MRQPSSKEQLYRRALEQIRRLHKKGILDAALADYVAAAALGHSVAPDETTACTCPGDYPASLGHIASCPKYML